MHKYRFGNLHTLLYTLLHFYCDNKLAKIIDIICYVNGILLAIIALMITGYSIFQALSGNKFVELCYKSKEKIRKIMFILRTVKIFYNNYYLYCYINN